MIGLVDYDLQTSTSIKLAPPNLEIMKLAAYYKREENTFCRLISLDETELSSYDKIFFFSEQDRIPNIPAQFLRAENVIYGGTAFTNKIYIPFENSLIDFSLPKSNIYKEYLKQKYQEGIKTDIISHILDDSYYRCYAGTEKLPIPAIIPRKRVFLYDRDFFYEDWEETIDFISARHPSSIVRIHPIICNKLEQYFTLRGKEKVARANDIILDLNIPLEDIGYMLKKYDKLFLADIMLFSNVFITLGGTFKTSFQYYRDFIYKLNLLYSFWSKNIPIKIKYVEPDTGVNDILSPLSKVLEIWTKNLIRNQNKTINDKIIFKTKKEKTPAIQAKEMLLKFHPSAKDLFEQSYSNLAQRRYWKI